MRQPVGTAPTTSDTSTPTPGSEPWEVASPKLNTPPSEPMTVRGRFRDGNGHLYRVDSCEDHAGELVAPIETP